MFDAEAWVSVEDLKVTIYKRWNESLMMFKYFCVWLWYHAKIKIDILNTCFDWMKTYNIFLVQETFDRKPIRKRSLVPKLLEKLEPKVILILIISSLWNYFCSWNLKVNRILVIDIGCQGGRVFCRPSKSHDLVNPLIYR